MMKQSSKQSRTRGRSPRLKAKKVRFASGPGQLRHTLKEIGKGIRRGSHYLPIIKHAQQLASRARPKDYRGQVKNIYDDFVSRWRYVHDPIGLELMHVSGPSIFGEILGFNRKDPRDHGSGDCDDSVIGIGAELAAVGLPVRVVTTNPPGDNRALFRHVFAQVKIPRKGWLTVDPVGHPKHELGWIPPHDRIAYWDLKGDLIAYKGQFPPSFVRAYGHRELGETDMPIYEDIDVGLGVDWTGSGPPLDWAVYGLKEFGAYAEQMGYTDDPGIYMEQTPDDFIYYAGVDGPLVRQKMLEMAPVDYELYRRFGAPRAWSVALGDDGDVYQYDPQLGFFRKLISKVGGAIKKGVKWVGEKAKKLISKLPGGKYLVNLYGKLKKVSMKLVKPLQRLLGSKMGKYLSKVSAFIPGYGPAIAAGLHTAGKILDVAKATGVKLDKKGTPKFKSGKQAKQFERRLKKEAEKLKRKKRRKKKERKKEERKKRIRRKAEKLAEKMIAERTGRPVAPVAPRPGGRLLKQGTPEHKTYLRGLGLGGF